MFSYFFQIFKQKTYNAYIFRTFHSPNSGTAILKNGRTIKVSAAKLAELVDGEAIAQVGETIVTATVSSKDSSSSQSFLPLTVKYHNLGAALGIIPGNFRRREITSDAEILISRLIDRSIRPTLPATYRKEMEVECDLEASDRNNLPDVAGINAASTAIAVSPIPWAGPIGSVRVGLVDGEPIINPTRHELTKSTLNLILSGTHDGKIVMIEASGENVLQQDFLMAIKVAQKEAQKVAQAIHAVQEAYGKPKEPVPESPIPADLIETAKMLGEAKFREVLTNFTHDKISRDVALTEIRQEITLKLKEDFPEMIDSMFQEAANIVLKQTFRNLVLETKIRCDGRGLKDLRPISCAVELSRQLHGSSLFTRGQTRVRCSLIMDSPDSAFKFDDLTYLAGELHKEKNFMVHYRFPGSATNEVGKGDRLSRREIGHGALAERAIRPIVPSNFPFVLSLDSKVLMSNGSSSMATVCAGSLALLDAGVPISAPVAGVAIGLITPPEPDFHVDGSYCLLTDLVGIEDYLGDMDFKMAGTKKGITALQLDLKLPGIPTKVVAEAVQHATDAKSRILSIMNETIDKPREETRENWPATCQITVPASYRHLLFGHGGMNIRKLHDMTGARLIQQDELTYLLFAPNKLALEDAQAMIDSFLKKNKERELIFGQVYVAKITEIKNNDGLMIILYPEMKPVFLHRSKLGRGKVPVNYEVGQEIRVQYFGQDVVTGELRISCLAAQFYSQLPTTEGTKAEETRDIINNFKSSFSN